MEPSTIFVLTIVAMAYLFDFINGFHDAANAIATIVTTEVLTPRQAILWAAFFSFIAFMFFNLMVAKTIGEGLIETNLMSPSLIFSALLSAIFWNLTTWYFGLPSSSSHALIGGLAGSAVIHSGVGALKWAGFIKVTIGILLAPLIGLFIGLLLTRLITQLLKNHNERTLQPVFRGLQLLSSACLSLAHGGNDAQKTMGIITMLLFSSAWLNGPFHVPLWIILSCQGVISLGTFMGGWRIVRTMGTQITQLNTLRGCTAETSAALIIFIATQNGIPVSTTQTVAGTIAGVGLVKGLNGVNWPMIRLIFLSWLFTIPATGVVAGGISLLMQ